MKIIIDIGHNPSAKGAYSSCKEYNEYDLNTIFASLLKQELDKLNVENVIVSRPTKSISSSVVQVNSISQKNDVILSLHCNAYNTKAQGSEILYYRSSKNGQKLASIIQSDIVESLSTVNRGIKALKSDDRGGFFLSMTRNTAIIIESVFIDNMDDLNRFIDNMGLLASRIAQSLLEYTQSCTH